MAPSKAQKAAKAPSYSQSSDNGSSQDASAEYSQSQSQAPEINPDQFAMMMNKQKEQTAARKTARIKEISLNRKSKIAKIQKKKEECSLNHQENIHTLLTPKLTHLKSLLERKLDLEAQLSASQSLLTEGAKKTIKQVETVLEERVSALK